VGGPFDGDVLVVSAAVNVGRDGIMLSLLAPNLRLASVLDLTLERIDRLDLKGLLLDVDCTLKDYHSSECPLPVINWIGELLTANKRLCLLSNGKPYRIANFARKLGIPFVAKAFKPLPFGCNRGLLKLGLSAKETAVVGDQLFADVMAGRLAGMFTVLVTPTSPHEPWFTRLKRPVERFVLRRLPAST